MGYIYKTALGQDSHRFVELDSDEAGKAVLLAGVEVPCARRISANSDGDVLFHALTNALSGISGVNILGKIADELCQAGEENSLVYLQEALKTLGRHEPVHVSISIECDQPRLAKYIAAIKLAVAAALGLQTEQVGLTATSGEGLTGMGQGLGIAVLCVLTVRIPE